MKIHKPKIEGEGSKSAKHPRKNSKKRSRRLKKRRKLVLETDAKSFTPIQSSRDSCKKMKKKVVNLTPTKSEHEHATASTSEDDSNWEDTNFFDITPEPMILIEDDDVASDLHTSVIEEFLDEDNLDDSITTVTPLPTVVGKKSKLVQKQPNPVLNSENSVPPLIAEYHDINNKTLVVLKENDSVYFHGFCWLSVLHGTVEILGYHLDKSHGKVKVFSFRGSSLFYVKNVTKANTSSSLPLGLPKNINVTNNSAIVLCEKLEDYNISFIEKHSSQKIILNCDSNEKPRIIFEPPGPWNLMSIDEEWNSVIRNIEVTTRIMICGGKGVGKSSFLRYAINRLLMRFDKVRVVDLDPGQPEFTPPGCISVLTVEEPIFGVSYTHGRRPDRSILVNISIADDPMKYLTSIKHLLNTDLCEMPTLINYMGFTHGIGINIASSVIADICPTDILQIDSQDRKKNFKFPLNISVVKKNAKLFKRNLQVNLKYNLHNIPSLCDENNSWIAQPRQLRDMSMLSYFGRMLDCDSNSILDTKLFEIGLTLIHLCDLYGNPRSLAAANANLVALCSSIDGDSRIFHCHGWGIVRGVDVLANKLVLITPEKFETLSSVTRLVLNGISLPPSIYMTPDAAVGGIPYVNKGDLMFFGQIPKRSMVPVVHNKK